MGASYTTIARMRAEIDKLSAADDATIQFIIDAASATIDRVCNRPEGFVALALAAARIYPGNGDDWQYIDECVDVTLVRVKESATDTYTTWLATDYLKCTGDRRYPDFNSLPYTALLIDPNGDYALWYKDGNYPTVEITAKWGFAVVTPPDIEQATIITVARAFKRGQSGWSDVLASGELGMLLYRAAMDPEVKNILIQGRYVKPVVGRR